MSMSESARPQRPALVSFTGNLTHREAGTFTFALDAPIAASDRSQNHWHDCYILSSESAARLGDEL
eukprot:546263-Rhodomonas_salina.16